MDTRGISDPNLYARRSDSDQRGGRIPIHSLLTPSSDNGAAGNSTHHHQQRRPPGPHPSPSESPSTSSPNYATAATTSSSSVNVAQGRQNSIPSLDRTQHPSSPIAYNDVRTNHTSPPTSSLIAADMHGRTPRPPRPSYSEEQKFFIMYARIMKDMTWPEIEDQFNVIFGTRTKGGLTSVYYRVRNAWGLMDVLKSGPDSFTADCKEVELRARNFSAEFLAQIGYLAD